jgi:hypothetical protein
VGVITGIDSIGKLRAEVAMDVDVGVPIAMVMGVEMPP